MRGLFGLRDPNHQRARGDHPNRISRRRDHEPPSSGGDANSRDDREPHSWSDSVGRAVVSRSADSRVDPTPARTTLCTAPRSRMRACDIVRVGGRCLRSNGEARQNRHANRRTSDFVGRCYRHHRHRNWLCRQIGDERDGLWTTSATRKRGTRLVAVQGSPRHRFWSSGNRRHNHCTR